MDDTLKKIALLQLHGQNEDMIAEVMACEVDELMELMRSEEYKQVYHALVFERHEAEHGLDSQIKKLASDSLTLMQGYLNQAHDPDYALKVAGLMLKEDRERSTKNKPINAEPVMGGIVIQLNSQYVNAIQERRPARVIERKPQKFTDVSQPGNVQTLFNRKSEDEEDELFTGALAMEI